VDVDEVLQTGEVDRVACGDRQTVRAGDRSDEQIELRRRGCRPDRRTAQTISPKARAAAASTGIGS
jgi:hypothetical protein